ncbi:MAG: AF1514 family protein [Gammaproteobacteria bacterium]|nr:AF1514 family protein [Gammaproteobacteria bacterium]
MNECAVPRVADYTGVKIIELAPENGLENYQQAMAIANEHASTQLGEFMLLSWYDRDRDFESPQHASECEDPAVPGYVDYGLHHGATLKVDFEQGRFVFFYLPL